MSTAAAPASPEAAPASGSKKTLVIAVAAVVVVAALGAAAWLLLPRLLGPAEAKPAAVRPEPIKATVAVGPVVVNLPGESRRYVRAGLAVGVANAKDAKAVEDARAQLTDLLIDALGAGDVETLLSADGRTGLKDELLGRIRDGLGLRVAVAVYFTEFVVQ